MSIFSGITDVGAHHNPNEGRVIINDNFRKMISGITESGTAIQSSHAELLALTSSSGLTSGAVYNIADNGVFVQALSTSELSPSGQRIMKTVKNVYYEYDSATILGPFLGLDYINYPTAYIPSIGDTVVWGGKVWTNLSGNTGAYLDEYSLDSEWELIPTTNDTYYEDKIFNIIYDFINNNITQQSDDRGNVVHAELSGSNYIDITDWGCEAIYHNDTHGIYNNALITSSSQVINHNIIPGQISNNKAMRISDNSNKGYINNNRPNNGQPIGQITFNTNLGYISNNVVYIIDKNSNDGYIDSCTVEVINNANKGYISNSRAIRNSNIGYINYSYATNNLNQGDIVGSAMYTGYAYGNTDRSKKITFEDLGGGMIFNKATNDQAFIGAVGPDTITKLVGEALWLDLTGPVINLELSFQWASGVLQGTVKEVYLRSSTPISVAFISGLPNQNSVKFYNFGGNPITFSNHNGTYAVGNIINRLDYSGGTNDAVLTNFGDWVEYEMITLPNVRPDLGTQQIPDNISWTSSVYSLAREINRANYPSSLPFDSPVEIVYINSSRSNNPVGEGVDMMAWQMRGEFTSDPVTIFNISWTDTTSTPRFTDLIAEGKSVTSDVYYVNGADQAIDGIYSLYTETGGAQTATTVFNF